MRISGLLSSREESPPGIIGTARLQRRSGEVPPKVSTGDIAVIDQADLDRATAEGLVAAGVSAVVNASSSISGKFPNLGPEVLLAAGITLVDGVGREVFDAVKDGRAVRLHEGGLFTTGRGATEVARGFEQDTDSVADLMIEAKAGMSAQLEAFSANTIEFLRRERMLVLDGVGVPDVTPEMDGRHVLVVASGDGHADDLKRLARYIREYRPVLVGVDAGADTLNRAGHRPDLIVGDPDGIATDTLKRANEVVVPAHVDGYAPGLERIQDLGIGAVTFPASGNPEDLALLLADAHGARVVVTAGFQASLHEFLDRGRSGSNPSTFLTRLRLGGKLVDASAVVALQRNRVPVAAVVLLVAAVLAVVVVALGISGLGSALLDTAAGTGGSVLDYLKGLFS